MLLALALVACGASERKHDAEADFVQGGSPIVISIQIDGKNYSMSGHFEWSTTTTISGYLPFFFLGPGQTCESIICELKQSNFQINGEASIAKLPDGRYLIMSLFGERNDNWAVKFAHHLDQRVKYRQRNSRCLIEKTNSKSGEFKPLDNYGYKKGYFEVPFVFIVDDLTEQSFRSAKILTGAKSGNRLRDIELISICTDRMNLAINSEELKLISPPDWMNRNDLFLQVDGIPKPLNKTHFILGAGNRYRQNQQMFGDLDELDKRCELKENNADSECLSRKRFLELTR
jgi:hypothetical protein